MPSHDFQVRTAGNLRRAAISLVALIVFPGIVSAIAESKSDAVTTAAAGSGSGDPAAIAAPRSATADPAAAATPGTSAADPIAAAMAAAAASDQTLFLELELNGHNTGKVGEFVLRRGTLMARASELRDLGFRVPETLAASGDGLIALSNLAGITFTVDMASQVLHVTVSDGYLVPTLLRPAQRPQDHREIESGTGVTLNYDILDTLASSQNGATAEMDFRAFSPKGVLSSGWLAYAGSTTGGSGSYKAIRLDSAYTFADVNSLRRYSLGDFITNGLSWTRPVRLLGAQIRSDFSTRPDLITFPLPTLAGSTAVPSTVDVLADGNLVMSSQIAPGPFEIPQLPVVSGAGTVSMTVTNAMGQQVTVTQPFYASSALLAKGLQTFAGQAGPVRRNWGSASNEYGKMAAMGSYRRGMSRTFTLEGGLETTSGTFMAGAGGVKQISTLGVLNFSAAGSFGSQDPGVQVSAGAQRIGRVFSLGGAATIANRSFRDVASKNDGGILRKQLSGFSSLYLRRFGSLGAAYAGNDEDASPTTGKLPEAGIHSHVVSVDYSIQLHHVSIYASEFKSLDARGSSGLQIGVTVPLGRRSSITVSGTSDGTAQFQAQQSATRIGEWGYQAYASTGNTQHEFAQVQYKSPVGLFTAGMDSTDGETTLRLESQGALSLVDRGLFPSNTVYDSFAIVDTSPLPHIRVLQENRDVGRTDSSGRLLVPDMRSFQLNHITIADTEVPADVTIQSPSREMRPQDRSGVVVKFPIKISHGALLALVDESGEPLPLGSAARLLATGVAVPVGYDGEVYVEDLSPHNELAVERPDGRRCRVVFEYRPVPGDLPSIGPLRCVETKP